VAARSRGTAQPRSRAAGGGEILPESVGARAGARRAALAGGRARPAAGDRWRLTGGRGATRSYRWWSAAEGPGCGRLTAVHGRSSDGAHACGGGGGRRGRPAWMGGVGARQRWWREARVGGGGGLRRSPTREGSGGGRDAPPPARLGTLGSVAARLCCFTERSHETHQETGSTSRIDTQLTGGRRVNNAKARLHSRKSRVRLVGCELFQKQKQDHKPNQTEP
jgi:hypothetical protein